MKNNTLTDSYTCEGQLSIFDILSAQRGKDISREEYKLDVYPPNTFFRIELIDMILGDKVYWRAVYNKNGDTLEFIDREHAEYFLKEHPEAVGSHDYQIRPRIYQQWMIDENQQEYGRSGNEWDGFIYR